MIASLEGNNLVILYMYFTSLVHLKSDLIRGVAFGGSGLIRGVAFGGSGLLRGVLLYIDIKSEYITRFVKMT